MKATRLVFKEQRQCEVEEFDLADAPEGSQVLVETVTSLISPGTEISIFNKSHSGFQDPNNKFAKYPFLPGYATCSRVTAVGPDVASVKEGDLVLTRGPHSSHHVAVENQVLPVPQGVSPEHVPFSVLGSISLNGIRHAHIGLGAATAVLGQGMIGLFALYFAKAAGAHPLIGIDLSDVRLERSRVMGADATVNPGSQDMDEAVAAATGGTPLVRIVESTGVSGLIPKLLDLLGRGGVLFLLGGAHGKVEVDFYGTVIKKNLSVIGGHEGGAAACEDYHFPWTNRRNMAHCLELMHAGKLDVSCMITDRGSPDEALKLYTGSEQNPDAHLGMLIRWGG